MHRERQGGTNLLVEHFGKIESSPLSIAYRDQIQGNRFTTLSSTWLCGEAL